MSELLFKGKEFVYNHHLSVPFRPINPVPEKSVGDFGPGGNLIIHGDNLHALKALMPQYGGKVDCVFIDPPYNTGNESWSYNDNVNSPIMKEWLSTNPVNREDMLRHDKWCCMMWPRLRLLHELMADDATIWMTIDDNEVARGRLILDEIFGEDNFIATVCWQKKYATANDTADFSDMHDFILVYAKNRPRGRDGKVVAVLERLERTREMDALYKNPDNDPRGPWASDNYLCNKSAEERPNLYYPVVNPATGKQIWPSKTAVWRYSVESHARNVEEGRVWWGINGTNESPRYKRFLSDVRGRVSGTWWNFEYAGHTDEARKLVRSLFPDRNSVFPTPKPLKLLTRILELATDEGSLVLDSFAGSGTTAHAVLGLNARDGGQRRFILVEAEDYADSETAERVRRVIKGYTQTTEAEHILWSKRINLGQLKRAQSLLDEAAHVEQARRAEYKSVRTDMTDGILRVIGMSESEAAVSASGASFAFCTLGDPLDLDAMLSGRRLPAWSDIGAWLFHTATGEILAAPSAEQDRAGIEEWYLGESAEYNAWLIYRPDLDFLRSRDSALTFDTARAIALARNNGKRNLVFGPSRFAPNKVLLPLRVEYAPLPFSLFRLEKA